MLLGQAVAIGETARFDSRGFLLVLAFTVFDLAYIVLLNDWADREVDATKRRMFPTGCSPKTIPDGRLPARRVLLAGLSSGIAALVVATVGGAWSDRPFFMWFGVGALSLFAAYSLPPIRLNYRGGGELLEMVGVGIVLPWLSAYGQSGRVFVASLWPVLGGFAFLALASAVASGLADERSDRVGGKHTVVTTVGNTLARRLTEGLLALGATVWLLAGGPNGAGIGLWLGAAVVFGLGGLVWRASPAAATDAFAAQRVYKRWLHRAIAGGAIAVGVTSLLV